MRQHFGALKRGRFRSLASLILVVNVVGELQQKRTLAASRGFLAAARLSCLDLGPKFFVKISTKISLFNATNIKNLTHRVFKFLLKYDLPVILHLTYKYIWISAGPIQLSKGSEAKGM